MSMLRVAVIGVGYLGRFHALIYSRLAAVELVGVVDSDAERAAAVAAEAGTRVWASAEALFDQIDAVSIVVPTSAHLAVARPFLARGIHVLLEKPIAVNTAEGAELVELAEQRGALLQIGHLERFNAGVMALAGRIREPRYLEAQRLGAFVERATDVDVVTDLMIHDIDIILALVDSDLTEVRAVGTPVLTEHVDIASARLEFANGAVANVVASRVSEKKIRRIRVFQPRNYLSLDFAEQRLDVATREEVEGQTRPSILRESIALEAVKPLDAEIAAFVQAVARGQSPLVDGRVGLRALEVALQVRERMAAMEPMTLSH
ncbi:Gfo/Idh/MocA family protein [Thiorhodovibrio frisius]|uniref:Putative dehydrogenase n=1 Tax=Thiorhodovibrio frisius TaxID=631362 RepID=H8Z777_9GAMM|nr:Gfo/Idh/MocA family oxidoreductase [Thiorhodovibrio frisius]EIC20876.1 putative dehydrogenase [Thiorhodovibrio frisius]WPL21931.1 4-carboxy-2-hydroxymuconate-6-semialdehyde dehydrogenase [Thiorhodovibrio frisius]